jgi:hypothetical protein
MPFQIFFPVVFLFDTNNLQSALWWIAGILACNFVMGYVGVRIHYHAYVERELLGGGKLMGQTMTPTSSTRFDIDSEVL